MKISHAMVEFHGVLVYIYIMISRIHLKKEISEALRRSQVVMLLGPRQCGKTTLAREFVPFTSANYFDMEDPVSLERLREPMTGLKNLTGTVVIDEIQRVPEIFPILRVLADRNPLPAKFLILGSASPDLMRHSTESLASRTETIEMGGFTLDETGIEHFHKHWLRGGYPRAFLASTDKDSDIWKKNYIRTVAEKDIRQLGYSIPAATTLRFWAMLAHYHGQIWNGAELARSLGVAESSVRRYIDLMTDIFLVRQLRPWHANIKKRQVKSPKIYFRDSGIVHQLLGIKSSDDLLTNPKCGASWEGYVIEEIVQSYKPDEAYFWATHNNAELDLLLIKNGKHIGVECKRADAPKITPSMLIALEDLELTQLYVIYPGDVSYDLSEKIQVVAFNDILPVFGNHYVTT